MPTWRPPLEFILNILEAFLGTVDPAVNSAIFVKADSYVDYPA